MRVPLLHLLLVALATGLAACATNALQQVTAPGADVVLLGEQHDQPAHQRLHREVVQALAGRGRLAALVLEMADDGAGTEGLPPGASEEAVRKALGWNERGWPWAAYGPVVMAAVRAGVPVRGGNLARERSGQAMEDVALDASVPGAVLARQQEAVREGHCDLLPAARIAPMTRIQIARDRAMARTLAGAVRPGSTVVLVAGAGHVDPQLGVPLHLPPGLRVRSIAWPRDPSAAQGADPCEGLRRPMPAVR